MEIPCTKEVFENFMFAIGKFPVLKKYLQGLVFSCDKLRAVFLLSYDK